MGGFGDVALVTCGVGGVLTWVGCFRVLHGWGGWHANMVGMSAVLTWVACYYYCYCYH